MSRPKGYHAVRWLRKRSEAKRGGLSSPGDNLDRSEHTTTIYAEQYLDWMKVHNRTAGSIYSRWGDLKMFLLWAEERGLLYPEQMTRTILESYQRYLWNYRQKNGKPLGISTQRSRLGGLKNFFSWLARQRIIEANPASELELPRFEQRLPMETPSVSEIEAILAVPDITDMLGIRDRAILETFYSTAIRRTELVRLQINDIHLDKHIVSIYQGKGHKDRVVPIGKRALRWIEKYLHDVRPLLLINPDEHTLFITGYGTAFNADVLSRTVARYIKASDTGYSGGCHLFRHACATHMLEGGADIRYIQQQLGHANLDATAIYTRVSITKLREVHHMSHPAEKRESSRKSS